MNSKKTLLQTSRILFAICVLSTAGYGAYAWAQFNIMSFFVTSEGSGSGGDLGGIEGADAHCQNLAEGAGAGNRTWRAYLSTYGEGVEQQARERIGTGPWYNAKGVKIAQDVPELHINPNIRGDTALDENGNVVPERRHDILTGTLPDGNVRSADSPEVMSCNNWTSSSPEHTAIGGHHDRQGGGYTSWNSAHSNDGCSQESLVDPNGGLFYCFAAD